MLTFLLFAIPLFILGPLALCLAVFRLWFPKHTLKINQTLLLPLALPLFCLANIYQLYRLKEFFPKFCGDTEGLLFFIQEEIFTDSFWTFAWHIAGLISFYLFPVLLTGLFAWFLRKAWNFSNTQKKLSSRLDKVLNWIGTSAGELLLNHMGQLTAYDPQTEELMVDVFSNDGFLFSGKYSNYFTDSDGKLNGVSITNAIRHRIAHDQTGKRIHNDAYIIPNQGEIFFPTEKIHNFHVWKLKRGQLLTIPLSDSHHPHVLAWYLSLKHALKNMNLRVKVVGLEFDANLVDTFRKQLQKLHLNMDGLEFDEKSKDSAEPKK